MTLQWHDLPVDASDKASPTLGERLQELRANAVHGRAALAFENALELANRLHASGLDREALELLRELHSFVTSSDVAPEEWPWFLNTRAMILLALNRYDEAESELRAMQALSEELPEGAAARALLSTALQNRGAVAIESGDATRAEELLRNALPVKLELEDWISSVDVLTSLALAVAYQGKLDEAEEMLSSVEELSTMLRDGRRIGAAFGNRAVIRIRRGDYIGAEQDFRVALRYRPGRG